LTLLLAMAVMPAALRAQSQTTGDITGVVTDQTGSVVPGADVTLKDNERGTTQRTQTGATGAFQFPLLTPGNYTVTVSASGFASVEEKTAVNLGQVSTVNVKLEVSKIRQVVAVTEAATKLQTDNPNVTDTVSEKQITELPNPGNDLSYIAQTAAGSMMNTLGGYGNFSSYGLPATSNLFTLDGMDDNDPFLNLNNTGATNLLLGQNEIAEASIVSSSYTGEYGTLAGANINYVTKGGTNQFHGNANYEWNGSSMNANDWFNNQSGVARPFSNANQWGGSFGGPIKKDKAFFFVDTEGLAVALPTSTLAYIPTPAFEKAVISNLNVTGLSASVPYYNQIFNLYNTAPGASGAQNALSDGGCSNYANPAFGATNPCALEFRSVNGKKTHEWLLAGRVDYNFANGKDRMFGRFQMDHGVQATYTDPINPVFDAVSTQPEYQGQLSETHTFGASAVNELILFGQWYSALFQPKSLSAALAAFPTTLALGDESLTTVGGLDYYLPYGRNVTQYGFSDDFSKTHGKHTLKFGVKFRRNDVSDHGYGPFVSGYSAANTLNDFANGGATGDYLVQNFPSSLDQPMATWALGAYAQDAWKVKPNFTLNLALRIEHNSNPVCQRDCFSRLIAQWDNLPHNPDVPYNQVLLVNQHQALAGLQSIVWEPRIGFAWQPLGVSRNTVIRGGFGIFGDVFPAIVVNNFSSNPPLLNAFTIADNNLAPTESSNLFSVAATSNQSFLNGFAAGQTLAQIQAVDPAFAPPSLTASDAQTKVPTYEKWSLEVEQGFGQHTKLTLSYVGNHGYHEAVQNAAVNAFATGFVGLPAAAPDLRFGPVNWITSAGNSSYNGLTISMREQLSTFQVQFNYTYSHSIDTISNAGLLQFSSTLFAATNNSPINPPNPYNIQANRGDSDYDVRQYFNLNYIWQVPFNKLTRDRRPNALLRGWQLSGTIFTRTGLPYTVWDGSETSALIGTNYGPNNQLYANFLGSAVASCNGPYHPCLTTTEFSSPTTGFGNLGRNTFRGPGYFGTDMGLLKYTNIPHWENGKLALGLQFYNLFNHPNFDNPVANLSAPNFGQVVRAIGPPTTILGSVLGGDASPRMIQLTARIVF
jgi:outer membrane receptor protein involved in Fe transport